jgi:hypothetical protein
MEVYGLTGLLGSIERQANLREAQDAVAKLLNLPDGRFVQLSDKDKALQLESDWNEDITSITAVRRDPNHVSAIADAEKGTLIEEFCDDRTVVFIAVNKKGICLKNVSAGLRSDREIVMRAVTKDGNALAHACEDLRNTVEVVMAAVRQNGSALAFASKLLRGHLGIVTAAVGQCGAALKYASPECRGDIEIVEVAVRQDGAALIFASPQLQENRVLTLAALRLPVQPVQTAVYQFPNIRIAYTLPGIKFKDINPIFRADADIAMLAVEFDGMNLQFCSVELRANRDIVEAAIRQCPRALQFACIELRKEIAAMVVKHSSKFGCVIEDTDLQMTVPAPHMVPMMWASANWNEDLPDQVENIQDGLGIPLVQH